MTLFLTFFPLLQRYITFVTLSPKSCMKWITCAPKQVKCASAMHTLWIFFMKGSLFLQSAVWSFITQVNNIYCTMNHGCTLVQLACQKKFSSILYTCFHKNSHFLLKIIFQTFFLNLNCTTGNFLYLCINNMTLFLNPFSVLYLHKQKARRSVLYLHKQKTRRSIQ